jgi:hypothetical protein
MNLSYYPIHAVELQVTKERGREGKREREKKEGTQEKGSLGIGAQ